MSDKRIIRINKILRELNISLDRAVDYLKSKGFEIDSTPNAKISDEEYDVLNKQFSADKGKKAASQEVSEEKKKEKEQLRVEREKELEEKRKKDEEEKRIREEEVIKAKAEKISTIKTVGKIDLEPKKKVDSIDTPSEQVKPSVSKDKVVEVKEKAKATESKKEKANTQPKEEVVKENKSSASEPKKAAVAESKAVSTTNTAENEPQASEQTDGEGGIIKTQYQKLSGATFTGQKIDLSQFDKPKKKKEDQKKDGNKPGGNKPGGVNNNAAANKNKRKRIVKADGTTAPADNKGGNNQSNNNTNNNRGANPNYKGGQGNSNYKGKNPAQKGGRPAPVVKVEPTEEEVKNQIKETLERLQGKQNKSKAAKYRKDKRDLHRKKEEEARADDENKILKVTEFVTVGEVATMMDVPITKVIGTCMSLGIMVTMNQRLDAETLTIVADEFGYEIQFVKPDDESDILIEEEDAPEDLSPRAPVVTIMGHVDHGKTSLLDYIRHANVVAGEAGGITQHIGAYMVTTPTGKKVTFLDTPGHEAFTAMRARGAKVADIAIIVIAADDAVMPQTKEAINHAQAAGVPLVFAFTKIDKPGANSDRIREQLSAMNILVEDWGGKFQSQEISGKSGLNVDVLLDKVLLEAEFLELKANPNKRATGSVIEATLDKGRGIVTTVLVQAGTLKVGDPILAGSYSGRVKALFNERGQKVGEAGPSVPVQVLGMQGAPTAGDRFNALESESEAREIANKRLQLMREQGLRTQKHITLDEIGRRLAIGNFKELNLIIKGDVDGSIEALSDSLLKLSTEEIQVNIISKAVGQISESDVLLASASDAIIIGFQVRPSTGARKLAEAEQIDIRLYSIIYDAINEIKAAMEGMLAPEFEEKITANVEIRDVFKITKVGTIAGCMVLDGKINRNSKIRIVRDGVVVYTGELASLKRYKDDVKEVNAGYECGLNIQNFNNIEVGDIVEAYEQVEVKRKL